MMILKIFVLGLFVYLIADPAHRETYFRFFLALLVLLEMLKYIVDCKREYKGFTLGFTIEGPVVEYRF